MTIDANNRDTILANYRKKLTEHREVEARLKEGIYSIVYRDSFTVVLYINLFNDLPCVLVNNRNRSLLCVLVNNRTRSLLSNTNAFYY